MECVDDKNTKVLDNNMVEALCTLSESKGTCSIVLIFKIGLQAVILEFKFGLRSIFIVILCISSLWSSSTSTSYLKIGYAIEQMARKDEMTITVIISCDRTVAISPDDKDTRRDRKANLWNP